ncbi:aldolase [Novosphingobium sp. Gsoil 351]|nr:aldolase [Novosphingobium sp. Gsoil 351]
MKQRLASGDTLWGSFLKTPSPILVEVLASAGLDVLCLDAEHAPFDRAAIDTCIFAARAAGMPVIVRTPTAASEHILNALDCGADGVLVPHVRTADEARALVCAAQYGRGGRGYAGSSRAAGYGSVTIPAHLAASKERTVVLAQIEDVEAVEAVEEIAAVAGLDALFIGRIDLTIALGETDPNAPRVIEAVERILAAGLAASLPVGMFVPRDPDVAVWSEKGARLFLQGSDHAFMRAGARAARAAAGL